MIDRTLAEDLLCRIAIAGFNYYPEKPTEQPGYQLDEDIDWCLEPLAVLPQPLLQTLRTRVGEAIADPTGERHAFIVDLQRLVA